MRERECQHELHAHTARQFLHVFLGCKLEALAERGESMRVPIAIGEAAKGRHILHLRGVGKRAGIQDDADALLELPFWRGAAPDRAAKHPHIALVGP